MLLYRGPIQGLSVIYKTQEIQIIERQAWGRRGSKAPNTEILILKNGRRILPAHFRFGLVKRPPGVNPFSWLFSLIYNSAPLGPLVPESNPLLAKIPKDSTWKAKPLLLPINYGPQKKIQTGKN